MSHLETPPFKQPIYLESNRSFGAVEANGNNGVFGGVLLWVAGDPSCLMLLVDTFLAILLCAHDGWDEGPSPGHPALVCLLRQCVLVRAGVRGSSRAFHVNIHH